VYIQATTSDDYDNINTVNITGLSCVGFLAWVDTFSATPLSFIFFICSRIANSAVTQNHPSPVRPAPHRVWQLTELCTGCLHASRQPQLQNSRTSPCCK